MFALKTLRFVPLLVLLVAACGCSSNLKGKIEGTKWSSVPANLKGQELPPGFMTLDFGNDGKLIWTTGPVRITGTYTLTFGDYVTLNTDQDVGGRRSNTEKITISGNVLTMTDSDGTALSFNKIN